MFPLLQEGLSFQDLSECFLSSIERPDLDRTELEHCDLLPTPRRRQAGLFDMFSLVDILLSFLISL